ncbi:MAG: hypothetical protein A2W23_00645 [Planctomycetes bacterium RBG_16_43_13]|nr:MAG: hypothetical protein A2W23_00645 [Planctomycetes bacterium RBG_16_43_13]
MNLVADLITYLVNEKIISSADVAKVSVSLVVGDAPKRPETVSRGFIVSRDHKPFLSVKFIPISWCFLVEDILKTRSLYAGFKYFKVPDMLGHFSTTEGHFIIEEYIQSTATLSELIENGDLKDQQVIEIFRNILSEIWAASEPPQKEFVRQEVSNYRNYMQGLIDESLLNTIFPEYIEKTIYDNVDSLRQSWSSGDIMEGNILLAGKYWYLVDYEYCHQTLFLFKEAYRYILHRKWAKNSSLQDICPWLGHFPEDVAILLSLAWEKKICSDVLDIQANRIHQSKLRQVTWKILHPNANSMPTQHHIHKSSIGQLQENIKTQLRKIQLYIKSFK